MSESLDRAVRNAREVRERLESDDDKRRRDERAAFVAAIDKSEELLTAAVIEAFEDFQGIRIEILARLALRFQHCHRFGEIDIGWITRVKTVSR